MDIRARACRVAGMIPCLALWLTLGLCSTVQANTVTYVYTDPQGTPLAEANASGTITGTFDYAPYGSQAMGPAHDGPGYTGHVNDADTALVYMQARYYDPAVGRFLSVDPVGPSPGELFHFNRYDYTNNNPINHTDPDGRCPQCLWGAPIGAGVNIAVQMTMAKGSFSERFGQISWGQVGVATAAGALSGGVSAIASTAATTTGVIGANVVGNMAVGAVAIQTNATLVENRVASASEVAKGAVASGIAAGAGAAIPAAANAVTKLGSAGMSQMERTATTNLLQGVKEATPDFKYTNTFQTSANAAGNAVGISDALVPLVEKKGQ